MEETFGDMTSEDETRSNQNYKNDCNFRKKYKKKKSYNSSEPITSYGLILYTMGDSPPSFGNWDLHDNNQEPYFLLYQRRDNFEYMDFLRGIWRSEGQLPALFSSMSEDERYRIQNYTFQELWDDLWVLHDCRIYKDGYIKAKKKFDSVKNSIPAILNTTTSCIKEPPWGFPKGKKNGYNEDPLDCAIREFEEETNIKILSDMKVIQDIPFTENFKGSNGKAYATHYYLAELPDQREPTPYKTPNCIRKSTISEEASKVEWFTYTECCHHLNPRRQNILKSVLEIIEEKQNTVKYK